MNALSAPVQQLNAGEIDKRLSRLISAEVDEFMRLVRKMEGRGVDLGPEIGYEREARLAAAEARREANPEEEAELEVRINQSEPGPKPWVQPEVLSYLVWRPINNFTEP
jgi:hypothetical protein